MTRVKTKQIISVILALFILLSFSVISMPFAYAAGQETVQVTIKDDVIAPGAESITVNLTAKPSLGVFKIFALDGSEDFDSSHFFDGTYTELYIAYLFSDTTLSVGDSNLLLNAAPQAGQKLVAVLRDSSGENPVDYISNAVLVSDNGGNTDEGNKKPETILANCSVTMMQDGEERTELFKENDSAVDVAVRLDDSIENGCYLTIFAYAGNTAFDADAVQNIRLWSGLVTDGYTGTCNFSSAQLPLKVGYKVIACLNVPCGEDNYGDVYYRSVVSSPIDVADEDGNVFQDYTYPDASISETEIEAGTTKLHINLTGDERLFKAAQENQIAISVIVREYRDGDEIDLDEGEDQKTLYGNYSVTAPMDNVEVTLSEPLRAGYRVRAITYWSQNTEIFLPKGNDYEKMFSRPDDSVLVSEGEETTDPDVPKTLSAVINGGKVYDNASTINIAVSGSLPEGNVVLLVKAYEASETEYPTNGGTWVGSVFDIKESNTITPQEGSLVAGTKLVAIILNSGNPVAVSVPVMVEEAKSAADDSLVINEDEFVAGVSNSAAIVVAGCDEFAGGHLILTTGDAATNFDADSRTRLASVSFTGAGTYSLDFNSSLIKAGDTVQAHIYKYNFDDDSTIYKYSQAVGIITESGLTTETQLEIVTQQIREDASLLYAIANFDASFTGVFKLYTYSGDEFDVNSAEIIKRMQITPSETSSRIDFTADLTAGNKIIAVLTLTDKDGNSTDTLSNVKVIQAMPEKQQPDARIIDETITAGDTQLKASLTIDPSTDNANFVHYKFTGDTLDTETAAVLSSGILYRSDTNRIIYLGTGRIAAGDKLQIVLTADGVSAFSNAVTVEPSPDWGTPYAAFEVSAVRTDDKSVDVNITYAEEYMSLGSAFYCDVSLYTFSASYTDEEFEERELWESTSFSQRVGQINSNYGDETRGTVMVPLFESAVLSPDDRMIIKLRLPHTEWEGEEVDYISASVPIIEEGTEIPTAKVILYNLGEDSSRGAVLRSILNDMAVVCETMTDEHLNETVGYLAGLAGYEAAGETYTGAGSTSEFMLICNMPEAQLDRFLDMMTEKGIRIDHKAVMTDYNKDWQFSQLISDIADEHEVFQALLELDKLIDDAEKLSEEEYGTEQNWEEFKTALASANEALATYEPPIELLRENIDALKEQYLILTGMQEIEGIAVITIEKDSEGTYTMTASVKDGKDEAQYTYLWKNGESGDTIRGIEAEKLMGMSLTVTEKGAYGSLTAQLEVPDAPAVSLSETKNSVTVSIETPVLLDNKPAAETYTAVLYLNGEEAAKASCSGDDNSIVFTGLSANTAYDLKIYAENPVGRSDITNAAVTTKKGSSSSRPSGGNSSNTDKKTEDDDSKKEESSDLKNAADAFTDISSGSWYYGAVNYAVSNGLMLGTSENVFSPNGAVTRGQIVTILHRLAKEKDEQAGGNQQRLSANGNISVNFTDIKSGRYYTEAVNWAASNEIVLGYDENRFGPDDSITREQLAAILYRYAAYLGMDTGIYETEDSSAIKSVIFEDSSNISQYAQSAASWASSRGLVKGTDRGMFMPKEIATRAQAAEILMRFSELAEN